GGSPILPLRVVDDTSPVVIAPSPVTVVPTVTVGTTTPLNLTQHIFLPLITQDTANASTSGVTSPQPHARTDATPAPTPALRRGQWLTSSSFLNRPRPHPTQRPPDPDSLTPQPTATPQATATPASTGQSQNGQPFDSQTALALDQRSTVNSQSPDTVNDAN